MREFEDGQYWIQISSEDEPEIARYDHGVWRIIGVSDPVETSEIERIGIRVEVPAGAFDVSRW